MHITEICADRCYSLFSLMIASKNSGFYLICTFSKLLVSINLLHILSFLYSDFKLTIKMPIILLFCKRSFNIGPQAHKEAHSNNTTITASLIARYRLQLSLRKQARRVARDEQGMQQVGGTRCISYDFLIMCCDCCV